MGTHVSCKAAGVREGHATGGAGVGTDTGMRAHVYRQVVKPREGHATGGECLGLVAGMGAHVPREIAKLRAGHATDRALKTDRAPRPAPPPLAQPSGASTSSFARGLFPTPLASDHREISRHLSETSGVLRLVLRFWSNSK